MCLDGSSWECREVSRHCGSGRRVASPAGPHPRVNPEPVATPLHFFMVAPQAHKVSLQRKLAERQADVAAQAAELAAVEKENEQVGGSWNTVKLYEGASSGIVEAAVIYRMLLYVACLPAHGTI